MALTRAQRVQAQLHSTIARDALPDLEAGRLIWNHTTDQLEAYDGTDWRSYYVEGEKINGSEIIGSIDGNLLMGSVNASLLDSGDIDGGTY